jgi:hypothetical protein
MSVMRAMTKETIELMARGMRAHARRLDTMAEVIDGPFRDQMIIGPTDAFRLATELATKILGFGVHISELELVMLGAPPPATQLAPEDLPPLAKRPREHSPEEDAAKKKPKK